MLRVNNIKLSPSNDLRFDKKNENVSKALRKAVIKKLRITENDLLDLAISKQSVDARKKEDVKVTFSVKVRIKNEAAFIKRNKDKDIVLLTDKSHNIVQNESAGITDDVKTGKTVNGIQKKVIVVGAGPAGLFCALKLAEAGMNPVLLERGEDVDSRLKTVNDFWQGKPLNPSSNVQFGEGGAGTFSDGKLNTMVKNEGGRMSEVYSKFVEFGADESILYVNKPHVGTDKLVNIVKNIRKKITELGGKVLFSSQVTDISFEDTKKEKNVLEPNVKIVRSVVLSDGTEIDCDYLVLALGHSARDTFEMLEQKGISMEQKPFAIGVRIQHPRAYIDSLQYGRFHEFLPAADYKLTFSRPGERSVYSFCMCPGGYVVNASSEEGRLAVNGMSYSGRDSSASNSAIVVQVNTSDFSEKDVLAGIKMQRNLEEGAFKAAKGKIPVQYLEDFVSKSKSKELSGLSKVGFEHFFMGKNYPECKGDWEFSDLNSFLPEFISGSMIKAFPHFGNLMKGFDSGDTLLLGLESRTSSPVRILRGEDLQSINCKGLFPCGEGAGYAGGITSAAMDGLKVAEAILNSR